MNAEMYAGDDLRLRIEVRDQNGSLVDITDAEEIRYVIVPRIGGIPIVEATLTGGGIVIANANTFVYDLVPADTDGKEGSFHHEADLVNAIGDTYTVLYGRLRIRPVQLTGI